MCCESSESLLIHCYKDSVCTASLSFSLYLFICTENNTFVKPECILDVGVICWTSLWPLSLPLIAVGITGQQGQNGLQRLRFHRCFPNRLFSPCARSPSAPKFPHLPPSHPTPRLGNGIKNKRLSPKIDTHFQEAGLTVLWGVVEH